MENIYARYACYKNAKKLGEYVKDEKNIIFTPEKDTSLDDAVGMSISIAKYFQMPVSLSFNNVKLDIPYQKNDMPTEQEIIKQFQNTNKR